MDDPLLQSSNRDGISRSNDKICEENKSSSIAKHNHNIKHFDGKVSWLVCMCCMLANVIVTGCVYTYGIFFPYLLDEFQRGKTRTALIASLVMGFYSLLAPASAKICLRYGCRITMVTGGLLSSLAMLASSFAPNLYVLYLTLGIAVGWAACLVFIAGLQILPLYFDKQRYLATCVLTVGPGLGVVVMSPTVQVLVDRLQWRGALRVLTGINVITCLLGGTITRKNNQDLKTRPALKNKGPFSYIRSIDITFLKDATFMMLALSIITTQLGEQMPFFHLAKYSAEIGIPGKKSSWCYFANGCTGLVFRLVTGKILDCGVPPLRLFQISGIVYAVVVMIVPFVSNFSMVLIYAISNGALYGLIASSTNCLVNKNYSAVKVGWFYFLQFIPGVLSPALAGFISDETGSYHPVFYTSSALLVLSVLFVQTTYCIKPIKNEKQTLLGREELFIFEKETVV